MCKCNPNIRAMFCGKPGCESPSDIQLKGDIKNMGDGIVGELLTRVKYSFVNTELINSIVRDTLELLHKTR
jgi:hypothetical protein